MDITAAVPQGKQVVESYGAGRFRVSGSLYRGSILVFPEETLNWDVTGVDALAAGSFTAVIQRAGEIDVLLLGCGPRMTMISPALRKALRESGIVIEPMDTGAACRTYNVLLSEGRQVGAALIAVD